MHRRTEFDDYYSSIFSTPRPELKLKFKMTDSDVPALIKKANNRNKIKTTFVETLEVPEQRSEQNRLFEFGKRHVMTPSLAYTERSNGSLMVIPEKMRPCKISLLTSRSK